jgi:hypothetical protein
MGTNQNDYGDRLAERTLTIRREAAERGRTMSLEEAAAQASRELELADGAELTNEERFHRKVEQRLAVLEARRGQSVSRTEALNDVMRGITMGDYSTDESNAVCHRGIEAKKGRRLSFGEALAEVRAGTVRFE